MAVRLFSAFLVLALFIGALATGSSRAYAKTPLNGSIPIVVGVQPVAVSPGSNVYISIKLSQVVTADQDVRVSTDTSLFTNWTDYVTVQAGTDHVDFVRTLTTTASGSFSVSAVCNHGVCASPGVEIISK